MAKARIMVVEDEFIVLLDIQQKLEEMGYEVAATASEGEEAVEKALESRPDLVIMDIRLGGPMDGVEAAGRIGEAMGIPVLFLSSYSDRDTMERAGRLHPAGYLVKPLEDEQFKATIEKALAG